MHRLTSAICLVLSLIAVLFWASPVDASLLIRPPLYIGLNSGLVGDWSFDQEDVAGTVAYDRSGQGNNGTLTNGPRREIGKLGQALSFDGVNDYVAVTSAAPLQFSGSFSASFWIKTTGLNSVSQSKLLFNEDFPNTGWAIVDNGSFSTDIYFRIDPGGSGGTCGTGMACFARSLINDGGWHLVTAVYDSSASTITLYVDGVQRDTRSSGTFTNNSIDYKIGQFEGSSGGGRIDDVRIYNRALNEQEIKRLYNIGGTLHVGASQNQKLTNGLVGLWSFDQNDVAGTVAYDRSGNANNGTMTNGPVRTIGKLGQALSFDGTNDYVETANYSSSLDLLGTSFTLTAWIKPSGASIGIIVGNPHSSSHVNPWFNWVLAHSVDLDLKPSVFVGCDQASGHRHFNSPATLNAWNHVLVTYDGALFKFYLNGVPDGSNAETCSVTNTNSRKTRIGANTVGAEVFPGSIDDVRVYNRVLSAQEIKRLYNIGGTLHVGASQNKKLTNGLVGMWSFDQADVAGTVAYDRSGQGNNGTLTNGPVRTIGKLGQGVEFIGGAATDYVDLPATLDSSSISVAGWVYKNGTRCRSPDGICE